MRSRRFNRILAGSVVGLLALAGQVAAGSEVTAGDSGIRVLPAALTSVTACQDTDAPADGNPDNDGDGLCDNWEDSGIDFDGNGTIDFQLFDTNGNGIVEPDERGSRNHKDLYVEHDFMQFHRPAADMLGDVIAAFANSPVPNPDGTAGIRLRIQVDEQVPHVEATAFSAGCPRSAPPASPIPANANDYCAVKAVFAGTAAERASANAAATLPGKRLAVRYLLWAHFLYDTDGPTPPPGIRMNTLGVATTPGDDQIMTLGGFPGDVAGHNVGSRKNQSATLMHEFGHNLGLNHGGPAATHGAEPNCKPNYLSVMSYSYEIDGVPAVKRPLDYSRQALPDLNEAALNEALGVQGPAGRETSFGGVRLGADNGLPTVAPASGAIDWNRNGAVEAGVGADINYVRTFVLPAPPSRIRRAQGRCTAARPTGRRWGIAPTPRSSA